MKASIFKYFFYFIVLLTLNLNAQDLLQTKDVSTIMKQIFDQHVDQKEITTKILKNSFKVYIDQFDPDRIYLLSEEVNPYLEMPDSELNNVIKAYAANNFQAFERLNQTIQKSIERARILRGEIERNGAANLFTNNSNTGDSYNEWRDPDLKLPFAKTTQELQERIAKQISLFIKAEKRHFGEDTIMGHQPQTLSLFSKNLEERENQYLFKDEHGAPLPVAEQQNLFIMHLLKALASSLDAHTTFYSNSEAYDMKVRLEKEFEGIGVVLQQAPNGSIVINNLIPEGPAAKSGKVFAKDVLAEVDGKKIAEMPFEKVMEMIRGELGSTITIGLKRNVSGNDQLFQVTLKREAITVQEDRVDTSSEKYGDGIIGTITLHSFYQGDNGVTSENDIRDAIKKLQSEGKLKGLVLDLRENSGGFLGQAVKVAGLFITNGVVVISKYFNGDERFYRDLDGKTLYDGPLIVLTSRATASAAEIVAQALQDYGVALVVGDDHTYGKGTIQSQTVTENNSSSYFKVTVGKYYTVSGKTPQINGVKADLIVPGIFNFEHIGEQYLDSTISPDTIPADYADTLADVNPDLKAWFLRYYIPTLQSKKDHWKSMLTGLQANSTNRIAQNDAYQNFLKKLKDGKPLNRKDSDDYQLLESRNILRDMITFDAQGRDQTNHPVTAGASGDKK